jgi:hypothetical protein
MSENPGEPGRLSIGSSVIAENLEMLVQGKLTLLHEVDPKMGSERVGDLYPNRIYSRYHASAGYYWKEKPKG